VRRSIGLVLAPVELAGRPADDLVPVSGHPEFQFSVTGILLRSWPDARPAGTPIGSDQDQVEGFLAAIGPGCGGVLEEDERGPVPVGELGSDLPGGLGGGGGRAGFGDDGQVAGLRRCGQLHPQVGNTLGGHRGSGVVPEQIISDQLAERRQARSRGGRQHGRVPASGAGGFPGLMAPATLTRGSLSLLIRSVGEGSSELRSDT
jgi:hypothetical protein